MLYFYCKPLQIEFCKKYATIKPKKKVKSVIPTKVEISVDEKFIKDEIRRQIDASMIAQLWFCDAIKIAELTCLSVRFLEEHVFSDVRMKAIEIKRSRKRLWKAEKALEVIEQIFQEW